MLIELAGARFLADPTFDSFGRYESTGIVLKKTRAGDFRMTAGWTSPKSRPIWSGGFSMSGIVLRRQTLELGNTVALTI
jgi:hypothetical protein